MVASYQQTAATYTAMLTTFTRALSLQILDPAADTALRSAGDALLQAAQRMRVHLSSAAMRCGNARALLDEAMLTPACGKEVAERMFRAFAACQVEWRASVEHVRVAGRCLERAAEAVVPIVERAGGVLGALEREVGGGGGGVAVEGL